MYRITITSPFLDSFDFHVDGNGVACSLSGCMTLININDRELWRVLIQNGLHHLLVLVDGEPGLPVEDALILALTSNSAPDRRRHAVQFLERHIEVLVQIAPVLVRANTPPELSGAVHIGSN